MFTNLELLPILLIDRSKSHSGHSQNIIWGNDSYIHLDPNLYAPTSQILPELITGENADTIKPRALKSSGLKKERTRHKAEVFTPTWVVKLQNDAVDGNYQNDDLDAYVDRAWLEITCGEGPYITSAYHMESCQPIPTCERVGFLDRKLQRINNEVADKEMWYHLVLKAYQSSYGFEWNGDSLLIARHNLLSTLFDFHREKWVFTPPPPLFVHQIAKIISYNIFQMDGLTLTIPLSDPPITAKIMDWRTNKLVEFRDVN